LFNKFKWLVLAQLLTFGTLVSLGQVPCESVAGHPQNKVGWAKDFLRVFFPELVSRSVSVTAIDKPNLDYADGFRDFTIRLDWREMPPDSKAVGITLPFASEFRFRRDDTLFYWRNIDFPQQLLRMREAVDAHKDWTDTEIAVQLANAGAQFGPDHQEKFQSSIPMQELKHLFGDVRVTKVWFSYRNEAEYRRGLDSAILTWHL
jgi:hypothetical protein